MTAVPAGPLLQALERHRQSFVSLKAVARVEIIKRGRRRALDTVGIVIDGQKRFRMEAYGPLGQSIMAIVWDGQDVLLRMPGEDRVTRTGPAGLGRLLGKGLEAPDLCAVLSGNIPDAALSSSATLRCGQESDCTLELRSDDVVRRVLLRYPAAGSDQEPRVLSEELYRAGKLVYDARFERMQEISHYRLPISIVIENPDKKVLLTIQYTDVEVNTPISEESFVLGNESGGKNHGQ